MIVSFFYQEIEKELVIIQFEPRRNMENVLIFLSPM